MVVADLGGEGALAPVARRDDEIVVTRLSSDHLVPPAKLPFGQDARQRRMHRHLARNLRLYGLHALQEDAVALIDEEFSERLGSLLIVGPGQRRHLAAAQAGEEQQSVCDAPVDGHTLVADELLDLVARIDGLCAPARILVDLAGQLALLEDARVRRDQLVDDGVMEEGVQHAVDVANASRRKITVARQLADQVADVPRTNLVERERAEPDTADDGTQYMKFEANAIIAG